jgi:acyl carrier protein
MKKSDFLTELKDAIMFEDGDLNEDTSIQLTSISTLSIIVLIDENFDKQVKAADLKNVATPRQLIKVIGIENFE